LKVGQFYPMSGLVPFTGTVLQPGAPQDETADTGYLEVDGAGNNTETGLPVPAQSHSVNSSGVIHHDGPHAGHGQATYADAGDGQPPAYDPTYDDMGGTGAR
jgi:hypothetical protein